MSSTLLIQDGDIALEASGRPTVAEGSTKRDLDIANALLTPLDLSRPAGAFGNEFLWKLGGSDTPALPGERLITLSVSEAIERLRAYQIRNPEADANERIARIAELLVQRLKDEPTHYLFLLRLESEAGDTGTMAKKLSFGQHNIPADVVRALKAGGVNVDV